MKIILTIAGFNIEVNFHPTEWRFARKKLMNDILKHYRGFITDQKKPPDFKINIVERPFLFILLRDKGKRRLIDLYEEKTARSINTFYQISLIHFQLILRDILEKLLTKDRGFILHASAVGHQEKAFIFTGKNGSGKSTAMKLLHPVYNALADDTVIIKREQNEFFLYQTPFIEKEDWVKKSWPRYRLEKVFFLRKADFFRLEKITDKNYLLNRLLKQFWTESQQMKKQLKYLMKFVSDFDNFYFLYFSKDKERLRGLVSLGQ